MSAPYGEIPSTFLPIEFVSPYGEIHLFWSKDFSDGFVKAAKK